jgi:hypothetical protein
MVGADLGQGQRRGVKKPGWPWVIVIQELAKLRALRKASPSGE